MKTKLLAIIGSHRKNGNSYTLAKSVLSCMNCEPEIIQLAEKKVGFCTICEECVNRDCVLDDDFDQILEGMKKADGIIFAVPRYLFAPSKFLAFLERLASIVHMRKHGVYGGDLVNPDYSLFLGKTPFCVFALSGRGEFNEKALHTVVDYIEYLGLKLVRYDHPPFIAVNVRAGDGKGEVLDNKAAIIQCKELARKVIDLAEKK